MGKDKRNRKCFESNLAAEILSHPDYFPAVAQVSTHILSLLTRDINKNKILNSSILDSSVSSQLFSNTHFGRIDEELNDCPTPLKVYEAIVQVLQNSQHNLQLTLHLHHIFMQKIYDHLPDKKIEHHFSSKKAWHKLTTSERVAQKLLTDSPERIKAAMASKIFTKELFAEVVRIKLNETGWVTNTIGITNPIECPDLQVTEIHQTVLGVFGTKDDSKWMQEISALNLPFVAGPSGHTGSAPPHSVSSKLII